MTGSHLNTPLLAVIACAASCSVTLGAELTSQQAWDLESLRQPPTVTWLDEKSPIRSLVYESEPYQGRTSQVFAFYATPGILSGDVSGDHDLPAVVLVHGGGGTAFAEWVELWAKRGYAAIAMDLGGHRPPSPGFDEKTGALVVDRSRVRDERQRLESGGPNQGHPEKFETIGGSVDDDWPYHAVASVIRAHSLIRSFDEVDAERTAMTGISWGGYLTCLVASVDDRFKAAVPVYGCGFLHEGESVQKVSIDRLGPERAAEWVRRYDPSSFLGSCRVPIMFVNGTNDKHYPLDSYAKSYGLVRGPRQLRIEVRMPHGHVPGWHPKEIGLFVDQHINRGTRLPSLGHPQSTEEGIVVPFESHEPLVAAHIHSTQDSGPLVDREWHSVQASVQNGRVVAPSPPAETTIWLVSVTDQRDAMVSTEAVFVGNAP